MTRLVNEKTAAVLANVARQTAGVAWERQAIGTPASSVMEKRAISASNALLWGGGLGAGAGLLATALRKPEKDRKRRWLQNILTGAVLGAGTGLGYKLLSDGVNTIKEPPPAVDRRGLLRRTADGKALTQESARAFLEAGGSPEELENMSPEQIRNIPVDPHATTSVQNASLPTNGTGVSTQELQKLQDRARQYLQDPVPWRVRAATTAAGGVLGGLGGRVLVDAPRQRWRQARMLRFPTQEFLKSQSKPVHALMENVVAARLRRQAVKKWNKGFYTRDEMQAFFEDKNSPLKGVTDHLVTNPWRKFWRKLRGYGPYDELRRPRLNPAIPPIPRELVRQVRKSPMLQSRIGRRMGAGAGLLAGFLAPNLHSNWGS